MSKKTVTLILCLLLILNSSFFSFAHRETHLFYDPKERVTQDQITLFLAGDLMLHGGQIKSAYDPKTNSYQFKPWFEHLIGPISASDYAILNFETTLTEKSQDYSGYPMFRSPVQIAEDMANVGFDIAMTANNHSLDNRLYGIETSLLHLERAGVKTTGTYARDQKPQPLVIEKNGLKIGMINVTYGTNGFALPKENPLAVNLLSDAVVDDQIAQLRGQNVDGILCFVHWGSEYQRAPSPAQKDWAKRLADKGVNWIIGSHPHVIQPEETITAASGARVYVNYSLGNFISNQRWRYSDTGLALNLEIKRENGVFSTKVTHLPFWVDKETETGAIDYVALPLLKPLNLKRLSPKDKANMGQALADFYQLYPQALPPKN